MVSEAAERGAAKAVAVSFRLLAPYIAIQAIRHLAAHHPAGTTVPGIALTAASAIIMPVLGIAKHRLGERLGSGRIVASAMEIVNMMSVSRPPQWRAPCPMTRKARSARHIFQGPSGNSESRIVRLISQQRQEPNCQQTRE